MNVSPLPRIYAITSRELSGLSHREQCVRLIAGGIDLIQIREKSMNSDELFHDVGECVALCHKHGVRILINDRVDIAIASGADGVHLGQTDMEVREARRLMGADKIIGVSTHNEDELRAALETDADYIAIGPVFGTTTKDNPDPTLGIEEFRRLRQMVSGRPVVAIGGINSTNFRDVLSAGADSVAVIGALYSRDESIEARIQAFAD